MPCKCLCGVHPQKHCILLRIKPVINQVLSDTRVWVSEHTSECYKSSEQTLGFHKLVYLWLLWTIISNFITFLIKKKTISRISEWLEIVQIHYVLKGILSMLSIQMIVFLHIDSYSTWIIYNNNKSWHEICQMPILTHGHVFLWCTLKW